MLRMDCRYALARATVSAVSFDVPRLLQVKGGRAGRETDTAPHHTFLLESRKCRRMMTV
jgi:hypothetical protein